VPWWTRLETPAGPVLHHDLTGRTLALSPESDAAWAEVAAGGTPAPEFANLLISRGFLGTEAEPRPESVWQDRWPILGRWVVFIQDGLEPLRVVERTGQDTGSASWTLRTLAPAEAFVWLNARGTVTTAELFAGLARLDLDAEVAGDALQRWTHGHQQLVKVLDEGINQRGHLPPHFYTLLHPPEAAGATRLLPLLFAPAHPLGWRGLPRTLAAGLAARSALRATPKVATVGPSAEVLTQTIRRARPAAAIAATAPKWPAEGPTFAHWQLDLVLGEFSAEDPLPADGAARLTHALAPGGTLWLLLPKAQAQASAARLTEYAPSLAPGTLRVDALDDWFPLPVTPVLAGPAPWLDALAALVAGLGLPPLPTGPITAEALRAHLDPIDPSTVHHLGFAPAQVRIGACPVADLVVLTWTRAR
jgi:hypothetical protein